MAIPTYKYEGSTVEVADPANLGEYISSGAMTSTDGFGAPTSTINITSAASTIEETRTGIPDYGDVTIEMYYQPDNAFQQRMDDMFDTGEVAQFRYNMPGIQGSYDGQRLTFEAYVSDMPMTMAYNDVVKMSLTLTITNSFTVAPIVIP